ncbi:MAG: thioredoxin family protein [Cytophagales bacterium]|nr:thioredoxin family protein [Cytophagales bacterium]
MKRLITLLYVLAVPILFAIKQKDSGYRIGDTVQNFKLQGVDGQMVSLSDYANAKGVLIVFTCNECSYSQRYEERLIQLNDEFAPKGVPVVAINPNTVAGGGESMKAMKKRAAEKKFTFVYLADKDQKVTRRFGVRRTPELFLLNGDNKLIFIGAVDNNSHDSDGVDVHYARDAIDALLDGKKPPFSFVESEGCTIKNKREKRKR